MSGTSFVSRSTPSISTLLSLIFREIEGTVAKLAAKNLLKFFSFLGISESVQRIAEIGIDAPESNRHHASLAHVSKIQYLADGY